MTAKTVTLEVDFVVVTKQYHRATVDLEIPDDYNMKEFSLEDFNLDVQDLVEDAYWSGTSMCNDEETEEITPIWD